MELNYNEEVEKLGDKARGYEDKPWFDPKPGRHKVHIVEVGQEFETEFEGKRILKRYFGIEVNNEPMSWSVPKGKTPASLYGQLMVAGKRLAGLENKDLDLIVTTDGKKRNYVVEQAIPEQGAERSAPPSGIHEYNSKGELIK